jgi:hypothetical protein
MWQPFTLLDEDWFGSESHEVALDNEVGILLAEEEGRLLVAKGFDSGISGFEGHGCGWEAWR